jgi:adenylyl-sulfate kinase
MKLLDTKNLMKSIVYRLYSFLVTFIITFLLTGNAQLSLTLGLLENFFKIATYYLFDMVWDRITRKNYRTSILWFTGLSGSGKTTIAKEVIAQLRKEGHNVMLLDGDEIRDIFKNHGFDKAARLRHINDVAKMAVYLQKQGVIPLVSLISPYSEARDQARSISHDFTEIYVNTPLSVCEERDVKGLYKKARSGEIKDFTGVHASAPYEVPENPDLILSTDNSIERCVEQVLRHIKI